MSEGVITALIVAVTSIICQVLINRSNRRKQTEEEAEKEKQRAIEQTKKDVQLESRLDSIEKKLDEHNGYSDKLGSIATDIAVIKNDIKTLYNLAHN